MKLVYSRFCAPLMFDEGCVCSLVVENRPMFRSLVGDIHRQINGGKGDCVLSNAGVPVDMGKFAELFIQLIPFSSSRKTLLTRVLSAIEQSSMDAGHVERTRELFSVIEQYLIDLGDEYAIHLNAEKLSVSGLLKLADASIAEDHDDALGTMLEYMDLVASLEREILFIFVNLRTYFDDAELKLFFEGSAYRKHRVLMLEGEARPLLRSEKRVVIDEDLCEIGL